MTDDVDDSTTASPRERWEGLSSVLALATGVSYPLAILLDAADPVWGWGFNLSSVPQGWFIFYSFAFIAVLTYALGPATIREARDAWAKVGGGN